MIIMELADAQQSLSALAERAVRGETVVIAVGQHRLRLIPEADRGLVPGPGPRPGRGSWTGRVTIPAGFYDPWTQEEMGEPAR